jgi:hypothetical protein
LVHKQILALFPSLIFEIDGGLIIGHAGTALEKSRGHPSHLIGGEILSFVRLRVLRLLPFLLSLLIRPLSPAASQQLHRSPPRGKMLSFQSSPEISTC